MNNIVDINSSYFSSLSPSTAVYPDACPLGTYETKMAARTGKRSTLTIVRKHRGL